MSAVDILPSNSTLHQHQHQHQPYRPSKQYPSNSPPKSPVAPSYSPITPKASIVLPVAPSQSAFVRPPENNDFSFSSHTMSGHNVHAPEMDESTGSKMTANAPSSSSQFIPQPPNLPFSADDSSDAIALRAAISTLQYQKQKAQGDLKTLESLKKLALEDPDHFTAELKAGRLQEVRPKTLNSMRPYVEGEEDSESDEDEDDEQPAVLGAERDEDEGVAMEEEKKSPPLRVEIPDSQPSQTTDKPVKFPKIPGPQEVIRTPYINWEKYGVVGAPLDSMHAQQQRWPGTTNFTHSKGREHTIAAPYSPFLDELEERREGRESRRDSGPLPSLTGTISEHVMSTRSRN